MTGTGMAPAQGLYIVMPTYTVCLLHEFGMVTEAPPIMRWAVGRPVDEVTRWVVRKGGTADEMTRT